MRKYHSILLFFLALSSLNLACATSSRNSSILTYHTVAQKILTRPPELDYFHEQGPFEYDLRRNFHIRVNADEVLTTDLYLSKQNGKAPLLIFQHGNRANKGVHAHQAARAASWGFHALVVEQPNQSRWIRNGMVLADLSRLLYRWPELINHQFDRRRIILVGHSFGGSAAVIAAGRDSPVAGIILLDPALVSPAVKRFFEHVRAPVILIGADPQVFQSRNRASFFRNLQTDIVEASVAGATHNDAQYPHLFRWQQLLRLEPSPQRNHQEFFTSAIIASSFSIASTYSTGYAWQAFMAHQDRFLKIKRK